MKKIYELHLDLDEIVARVAIQKIGYPANEKQYLDFIEYDGINS